MRSFYFIDFYFFFVWSCIIRLEFVVRVEKVIVKVDNELEFLCVQLNWFFEWGLKFKLNKICLYVFFCVLWFIWCWIFDICLK